MKDVTITRELYTFYCLDCPHTWKQVYEVRRAPDYLGAEMVEFFRNGLPATPPWADITCPVCGGIRTGRPPRNETRDDLAEPTLSSTPSP